jgi:hypothetical protein
MKRRNFLSAASIAVAAGVTSGLSATASTFNGVSSFAALNEFSNAGQSALSKFKAELSEGLTSFSGGKRLAENVAMPVRIISKTSKKGLEQLIYKNKAGQYIRLRVKDGVETFYISNDAIYA